jgi:hypothetical protein
VAGGIVREIDTDGDGVLSREEQQTYARGVLGALTLHVDDSPPLGLRLVSVRVASAAELASGDGAITIHAEAAVPNLSAGPHRVSFRNDNAPQKSVYLANALVPEDDRISITEQRRDGDQSELAIDVDVRNTHESFLRWWLLIGAAAAMLSIRAWRTAFEGLRTKVRGGLPDAG